jgi:hypothetical protein
MNTPTLSNVHADNEPPDRAAPAGQGVAPQDRPTAQGGPKPDVELPASHGGRFQRDEPSRAERTRQR